MIAVTVVRGALWVVAFGLRVFVAGALGTCGSSIGAGTVIEAVLSVGCGTDAVPLLGGATEAVASPLGAGTVIEAVLPLGCGTEMVRCVGGATEAVALPSVGAGTDIEAV